MNSGLILGLQTRLRSFLHEFVQFFLVSLGFYVTDLGELASTKKVKGQSTEEAAEQ